MKSSRTILVAAAVGLISGLGGSWLSGSPLYATSDTVEAGRFVVRIDGGRVLAELGPNEDGGASLTLKDRRSQTRAAVSLDQMGEPSVKLYDDEGIVRSNTFLFADGRPAVRLMDADGQTRGELSLGVEGEPGLGLSDRDGKGGVWVYVALDGSRGRGLLDQRGAVRAEMSLKPGGQAALVPFRTD